MPPTRSIRPGKTAGVINTDVDGRARPGAQLHHPRQPEFGLLDMLVEEGAKRGRRYTPDPQPGAGDFFRSDHFTFAKTGIPAISFGPGNDLVNGGVARGEAHGRRITRQVYHQPDDEYQPDWDFTGMAAGCRAAARRRADWRIQRDWPNWSQDSEFRAARDRQRRRAQRRRAGAAPSLAPPPPPKPAPQPGEGERNGIAAKCRKSPCSLA